MMRGRFLAIAIPIVLLVLTTVAYSESLPGHLGSDAQRGRGWIDLDRPTDFKQGETLKLKVGLTATRVLVRLLKKYDDPNEPNGIVGGIVEVPKDRTILITLREDHPSTIQISVNGGPNPWKYLLGIDNGPATLESAEREQK